MARKNGKNHKKEESRKDSNSEPWLDIHPEVKQVIFAVGAFVLAALFAISSIGKGGALGGYLYRAFGYLLGSGYFFAPVTLVLLGFSFLFSGRNRVFAVTVLGGFLFFLASLLSLDLFFGAGTGGAVGRAMSSPMLALFDFWGAFVITLGIWIVALLLLFNIPFWKRFSSENEEGTTGEARGAAEESRIATVIDNLSATIQGAVLKVKTATEIPLAGSGADGSAPAAKEEEANGNLIALRKIARRNPFYKKPPLELLQEDTGKPSSGDIRANANIIKRTLENFGVEVEMGEISVGPTVTQYTLKPAEGVKLSRITALRSDLSLALAAHPIRIEAPIPGKSLAGIEVPNKSIALVGLRALLGNAGFAASPHPLLFAVGRDVAGSPVYADLSKMPHLLISGATGSGKSVTIHSIIISLLYRNSSDMLRFILIDPKRVELPVYNDIPHLLTPVITDPKKTIQALRWATKEMDRRYDLLSKKSSRDIVGYNSSLGKAEDEEALPYIVILIDELADLMAIYPREMEGAIVRLAQMARAVGIHLIVSTQRPSVEVITGLIKANITSRIALQVASQIDSRTILDTAGAETLLGNGDLLFMSGDTTKPKRIQGGFISEHEVKRVVDFLREEFAVPEYDEAIFETKAEDGGNGHDDDLGDDDPLIAEAEKIIRAAGKASASYLQRRLRVGYARAARLLDILESRGIIGPADGAKPREVFAKSADSLHELDSDEDEI
ncbi:MAG: cell division FtsK/SpoIIIE [Parcubacteria group bacterium GW2011_GWB1_50_9]|nr:MAG: cell division FtsK/SpoIIIE [Parcubacteria group bacterium GW2011_GWB1_50_9]